MPLDKFNGETLKISHISITSKFYIATLCSSDDVVVDLSALSALALALPNLTTFIANIVLNKREVCEMEDPGPDPRIGCHPRNHGRTKEEVQRGIENLGRVMLGGGLALPGKIMKVSRHTMHYICAKFQG